MSNGEYGFGEDHRLAISRCFSKIAPDSNEEERMVYATYFCENFNFEECYKDDQFIWNYLNSFIHLTLLYAFIPKNLHTFYEIKFDFMEKSLTLDIDIQIRKELYKIIGETNCVQEQLCFISEFLMKKNAPNVSLFR